MVQYLFYSPKKIRNSTKKIIRAISWSDFNAPTRSIFFRYGLLRLTEYNIFHNACTMYQVVFGLNNRLCELVPIHYPRHTYLTRNMHIITGKKRRLKSTGMSVVCRGPRIWNELDESLKTSSSISSFKQNLKKQLLNLYTSS